MTSNNQNTPISEVSINELRQTIRASWITSVKAIYTFGKEHSRASIEASLKEIGLSLTNKANTFTGAAKLGLSEKVNGKWSVCDGQVSRYARVCKYLNSLKIAVDDVEKALEGKTMTELVQNKTNKTEITETDFKTAVEQIKANYPANDLIRYENDKFKTSSNAGLKPGANMAIVLCDMEGNITAIRGVASSNDKLLREQVVAVGGKEEVSVDITNENLVDQIVANAA